MLEILYTLKQNNADIWIAFLPIQAKDNVMENTLIKDIKIGNIINQIFLVQKSDTRKTKTGSIYITAQLSDRSGLMESRLWNATKEQINLFETNDILNIKGRVESFQNNLQLIVESFSSVDQTEVDMGELLPCTEKDIPEMLNKLKEILYSVDDKNLINLFKLFLEDEEFCKNLCSAPAAVQYHHAFLGGLLEHIISVLKLAGPITEQYAMINRDILYAGIFFHDIGKIEELSYTKAFKYTDEGQLLGHLITGIKLLNTAVKKLPDFPSKLLTIIEHLILSHHGSYEWGSPKLPMTIESIALHYLDNFDAKIFAFNKAINEDKNEGNNWTEYNRMFERKLYKNSNSTVEVNKL